MLMMLGGRGFHGAGAVRGGTGLLHLLLLVQVANVAKGAVLNGKLTNHKLH